MMFILSFSLTVQSDPKISALLESNPGVADHCGAYVPVVQTECTPRGQQLHPSYHGDHYPTACCYPQVRLDGFHSSQWIFFITACFISFFHKLIIYLASASRLETHRSFTSLLFSFINFAFVTYLIHLYYQEERFGETSGKCF